MQEDPGNLLGDIVEEGPGWHTPQASALKLAMRIQCLLESLSFTVRVRTRRHRFVREWSLDTGLLGTVDDWIAERVPCSVVFCRRYGPVAMAWLRYRVKRMGVRTTMGSGQASTCLIRLVGNCGVQSVGRSKGKA